MHLVSLSLNSPLGLDLVRVSLPNFVRVLIPVFTRPLLRRRFLLHLICFWSACCNRGFWFIYVWVQCHSAPFGLWVIWAACGRNVEHPFSIRYRGHLSVRSASHVVHLRATTSTNSRLWCLCCTATQVLWSSLRPSYSPYHTPLSINSARCGYGFSSICTFPRERYGRSDDCHSALPNNKRDARLSELFSRGERSYLTVTSVQCSHVLGLL